jgi:hypothetical protein
MGGTGWGSAICIKRGAFALIFTNRFDIV